MLLGLWLGAGLALDRLPSDHSLDVEEASLSAVWEHFLIFCTRSVQCVLHAVLVPIRPRAEEEYQDLLQVMLPRRPSAIRPSLSSSSYPPHHPPPLLTNTFLSSTTIDHPAATLPARC